MKQYKVKPGSNVKLSDYDPSDSSLAPDGKSGVKKEMEKGLERMAELQDVFYAAHDKKLLIVLQGLDGSGKDGTIDHVFEGMSPLGIRIAQFEAPTKEELDHDFLWRIHRQVPGRGEVAIFNRSHYEDVLVVRVREIFPEKVWRPHYEQINNFERLLAETGTTILKFFLHIGKDEQRERLQKRIDDPTKRWKFRKGDLDDRARWDDYQTAYAEALSLTSTDAAPWYVVPSDHKWYRNYVISKVILEAFEAMNLSYPAGEDGMEGTVVR